ncbi:MAG: hypothetical protein JPMHGGIA_00409 [Saprospiraceae bacterium]|jgi:hypothetical protein|nr:hypothetical protein [Saprospiraceae bacterium]
MKFKIIICSLILITTLTGSKAQCVNRCLSFDGVDDRVLISNGGLGALFGNSSFAIELWFYSTNTCSPTSSRLLSLASNFYIDVCGTSIILNYPYMLGNPIKTYPITIVPNTWHLLSIRSNSNGSSISTLIDGAIASIHLVIPPHVGFISSDLIIGGAENSWMGKIDELKIWSTNNPPVSSHNCPCSGNEPELLVYIPFDDDFGVTSVNDKANSALLQFGNNSGQLLGAPTIICSDAPLIYPDYYNLELDITDYWNPTTVINSICSGDPAHFCLMQDGNIVEFPNVPAIPNTSTSVIWEYADLPGGLWMPVTPQAPAFKEFCFPVAPNLIVASCPNSDGYTDRKYRAKIVVTNTINQSCTYLSDEKVLRIYCPLPSYSINLVSNPTLLCAGDLATLDFTLVPPAPTGTIVQWKNGAGVPFGSGNSVSLNNITVLSSDCVYCMIMNGNCPPVTLTKCINVDQVPMCGLIDAIPTGTLTLITTSPLKYEICPGNDASLTWVSGTGPFANGIITWQYMFPSVGVWNDLGTSNSTQNTNVLPCDHPAFSPYLWPPIETCIVYRVQVHPFSDPSGCEPCYSNELTICLKEPMPDISIYGSGHFLCEGATQQIAFTPYDNSWTTSWYCNGELVSHDKKLTTDKTGCYMAEVTDGCTVSSTQVYCTQVCYIIPKISCPLDPNKCARPGMPIYLSACESQDLCQQNLAFTWSWDGGTLVSVNGCQLEHIPALAGTNYSVTVTNSLGCSESTSLFVKPCHSN